MFQTSMELWEAERRYQAGVVDKARGYEGPGLTSLAEEQVHKKTQQKLFRFMREYLDEFRKYFGAQLRKRYQFTDTRHCFPEFGKDSHFSLFLSCR